MVRHTETVVHPASQTDRASIATVLIESLSPLTCLGHLDARGATEHGTEHSH